jgi:hypothetical protein
MVVQAPKALPPLGITWRSNVLEDTPPPLWKIPRKSITKTKPEKSLTSVYEKQMNAVANKYNTKILFAPALFIKMPHIGSKISRPIPNPAEIKLKSVMEKPKSLT